MPWTQLRQAQQLVEHMFTRNNFVYWLFRVYAVCTFGAVALHVTAWLSKDPGLHRTANYVLLVGLAVGFLPLLGAFAHAAYVRLWRKRE